MVNKIFNESGLRSRSGFSTLVTCWSPARFGDAYIDGLVHDCSNSSELVMELQQSWTKPSKWFDEQTDDCAGQCISGTDANVLRIETIRTNFNEISVYV